MKEIQLQITVDGCINVIWNCLYCPPCTSLQKKQDQTKNSNVLDDQATLKQAEQAKMK